MLIRCGGAATPTAPMEPTAIPAQPTTAPAEGPETGMVELPEVNPLVLSGNIVSAGSSTVFPLSERMAERFKDEGFGGEITIDSIGSGAGLERFCVAGETDIANASRAIKDDEVAACTAIGRTPIEFRVGTDALAVVVSSENDFLTDVSTEQLALIFSTAGPGRGGSGLRRPILHFSPGTDSGRSLLRRARVRPKSAAVGIKSATDKIMCSCRASGSPKPSATSASLSDADKLAAVSIDGVTPTAETAENGEYPLARPLFIYSDPGILAQKPQVAGFINFYLTFVNEEILDVGYFPASDEALDAARQAWLDAVP
jgi:phosphate transport system substrate-binding protein